MPEAVIVSALRTPIGTARKGTLRDTTAFDLAHHVVTAAAKDLDPAQVDDVILGEGLYGGGVLAGALVGLVSWMLTQYAGYGLVTHPGSLTGAREMVIGMQGSWALELPLLVVLVCVFLLRQAL